MLLAKLISRIQRGGAARDVATLTMGTVIAQAITIAFTPLLTRLYTPDEFGLLAVFLAVVSVCATFVTLRFETSILVPKENTESANLVLLSLILAGWLSVVLLILSFFLPMGIQEKVGLGILGNWISIACLTAATTAAFSIMQGWMIRQKKYKQMAFLRVGQSSALAGLAVCLGILNVSNGLLIAQIFSTACFCLASIWLGRAVANLWKKEQLQATAVVHKNAPKYLLPTSLLDVVTLQMPVLLIAMWFGADEAGQFSMAWRLLMVPMALVGGAIGQVFMQRFSVVVGIQELAKNTLKLNWLILFILGLFPFLLIFLIGDVIFLKILGDKWVEAGLMAKILSPMAFAMFISSPTSGSFVILSIQKYSLFFGLASLVYRPASLLAGYYKGDIYFGIGLWVFFEILQIFIYQIVAWKKTIKFVQ